MRHQRRMRVVDVLRVSVPADWEYEQVAEVRDEVHRQFKELAVDVAKLWSQDDVIVEVQK